MDRLFLLDSRDQPRLRIKYSMTSTRGCWHSYSATMDQRSPGRSCASALATASTVSWSGLGSWGALAMAMQLQYFAT